MGNRMSKKYTYHKSHSFVGMEDDKHTFATQLYQIGVYGILDGNSSMQGNFKPAAIIKMEKNLVKLKKEGKIKSFELGVPITVSEETGFWEEVNE
jgi:hypothetical protein